MAEVIDKILEYYSKSKKLANGIKTDTKELSQNYTKSVLDTIKQSGLSKFKSISTLPDKQKKKVLEITEEFRNNIYTNLYSYVMASRDLSKDLNDDLGWEYISLSDNGVKEYMERTFGDKTTKERININTNRLRAVIETYLIAEISLSLTKKASDITKEVQKKIWDNISSPYTLPSIIDNVPANKIRHFGRGYATNGISQIYVVEQQMILGIFNKANYESWRNLPGFLGWKTMVTSKNPCQFCIDETKILHHNMPNLPFHGHCLCIVYPVFKK